MDVCTHLRTRTDQPRLAGSDPNVSSRFERTCAVNVFESIQQSAAAQTHIVTTVLLPTPNPQSDENHSPANPSWSSCSWYDSGQYATPYTIGPSTGPRPASSTPMMYGPSPVGVVEW